MQIAAKHTRFPRDIQLVAAGFSLEVLILLLLILKCFMKQLITNSNWIEWSTIQGVIARVISRLDEREADLILRARLLSK